MICQPSQIPRANGLGGMDEITPDLECEESVTCTMVFGGVVLVLFHANLIEKWPSYKQIRQIFFTPCRILVQPSTFRLNAYVVVLCCPHCTLDCAYLAGPT